jgi:SAM-dependent methyltransferase
MSSHPAEYVPGHGAREIERLIRQAELVEPITRRFFVEAGIAPGKCVLDIGSGVGDVTFLAADLVGEAGHVTGIDQSSAALAIARTRSEALGLGNVRFEETSLTEFRSGQQFDAVVGRYILMYMPEVAAVLRRLVQHVRPGGLLCFHEPSWASARSSPPVPSWEQCCSLVVRASTPRIDFEMGSKLHTAFVRAGLPAPALRSEAIIGAGSNSFEQVRFTTDTVIALLPHLETLGVISPGEVDPEGLADRVYRDVAATESLVVGRTEIGAWSRVSV